MKKDSFFFYKFNFSLALRLFKIFSSLGEMFNDTTFKNVREGMAAAAATASNGKLVCDKSSVCNLRATFANDTMESWLS